MGTVYLDSSVIMKLVRHEAESLDSMQFLATHPVQATSTLSRVEVGRALLRQGLADNPTARDRAARIFAEIDVLEMSSAILALAAMLRPVNLRALDAIHLASALSILDLAGMVVYDRRLAEAARAAGIIVWSPGQAA